MLAAYSYDTVSHNLSGMTYGNDTEGVASYQYTYDRLDRMIGKTMPYTGEYFAYVYDYLGNVVEEKYSRFGSEVRTYHFEYDRLGRPVSRYETENGVIVEQKESTFDAKGRDLKYTYVGDDFSYTRDYSYYDETGWLGSVTQDYNGEREITAALSYANLGRVRFRVYGGPYIGRVSYTYQTDSSDPNRIISNMTSMRYTFGGKQTFADYSYDNIGNVKHAEYKYDSIPYTFVDYNYDRYNQLTKEVHSPLSMGIDLRSAEYAYDEFGNITDVTRTDSSGKVTKNRYVYSDKTGWQDLLTSYNGHTITYDEIGNPLSYYNGKNYSFEWEAGRRLHNSASGGNSINYYYNKDGIRTEKSVSGKYTDRYILDGDRVIGMERTKSGSSVKDVYHFIYDEMGNIWEAVCYIGGSTTPVRYFYRTNAQGDVKQIVDSNYNVVAYYAYDAWGKLLAVLDGNDNPITDSSHFAIVNPFRYRGYIYDTETGFYYLQSRYYDPEIGRFINADGLIGANSDMATYNLFAYCGNNPVVRYDDTGMFWKELISGVIHVGNNFAVAIGIDTAAIGAFFLMMEKDGSGVYHARQDCWQQYGGYNDLYDFAFNLGTSMEAVKFSFSCNGSGYTIWAWKGDYVNLGAGAELGIYRGSSGHRTVDTSLAMWMGMIVSYNGEWIIDYFPSEDQWWITGFNPKYQNVSASNLRVTIGVGFNSTGMYQAFKNTWGGDSRWSFYDYLNLAILQF